MFPRCPNCTGLWATTRIELVQGGLIVHCPNPGCGRQPYRAVFRQQTMIKNGPRRPPRTRRERQTVIGRQFRANARNQNLRANERITER